MIETDDFLADLEAHLREAAEREDARRGARRWRPVVRVAAPVLAVAALVALAVAVLPLHATERPVQAPNPTVVASPPPSPALLKQAKALLRRAGNDTAKQPACRFVAGGSLRLVDGTPLPAITAALPALATPSADPEAVLKRLPDASGGAILRSTLREVAFPGGVDVRVFVLQGREIPVADPAACGRARAALVTARSTGVLRAVALALLASDPVVSPDTQTLHVEYGLGRGPSGGVGMPLVPGRPVPIGVIAFGGSVHDRTFVAIADPRAVTARAGTATVKVRDGLYAFRDPPSRSFEELDAAGKVLRRDRAR